ncbi:metallophosphoesterase [Knoellia koreensis]|uniref:Calcineurin-like phosphoesterase domain-containing protein n=1 Tax=Knoellia koreensis TaxID=2730921 RepID=A0A849HKM1_9MICO|nr:metallophosphoesterase [Knoellia sp. DB2414S]NNM47968.1 hypothetical protein [Knoellia sp. DB2414S]
MRRGRWGLALVVTCASVLVGLVVPTWASASSCLDNAMPVLKRVNPQTTSSIDTIWLAEAVSAASRYGYTQDPGVEYQASWFPNPGLRGIHRLYKQGDFRMVPAGAQLDAAVADGYVDQGAWFYAYPQEQSGCTAVRTFEKDGRHRMAATDASRRALEAQGWQDLGVAFWTEPTEAVPPAPSTTTPAPTTTSVTPTPTTTTATATSTTTSSTPPAPSSTTTVPPTSTTTTTTPSTTATTTSTPSATTTTTTITPPPTTTTTPPQPPRPVGNAAFTIAVMPDTQEETSRGLNWGRFDQRARWLAENKSALNLAFVGASGDVTNWGWVEPQQLSIVSDGMRRVEGAALPYALPLGNHDTRAVGWDGIPGSSGYGGSAYQSNPECQQRFLVSDCQSAKLVRHTEEFNRVFTAARYRNVGGAFEPGKVDNVFSTFNAGGKRWLVLTLELWPRPAAIEWARNVVEQYPDHNVIIQTHSYLNGDGTIGQDNGGYGSTSPQYLYDRLVSQYPNIKMVFSGHVGSAATRTDRGVNGNTIYSFLTCMHDRNANPVRLIGVDPAAGTISTKVEVPWTGTELSQYAVTFRGVTFVG